MVILFRASSHLCNKLQTDKAAPTKITLDCTHIVTFPGKWRKQYGPPIIVTHIYSAFKVHVVVCYVPMFCRQCTFRNAMQRCKCCCCSCRAVGWRALAFRFSLCRTILHIMFRVCVCVCHFGSSAVCSHYLSTLSCVYVIDAAQCWCCWCVE